MGSPHEVTFVPQDRPLWRALYIAKDHAGDMLGMILAPSYAIAEAYFLGAAVRHHSIEVIDPCDQTLGNPVTGVCIVATLYSYHASDTRSNQVNKLVR